MKGAMLAMVILTGAVAWPQAASRGVEAQDVVRRTLSFGGGAGVRRLEVDNVFGGIRVTGSDTSAVQLVARQRIKADNEERLALARQEVTLDIREGPSMRIYVDGPFRDERGTRGGWRNYNRNHGWSLGYEVKYDFELNVPREVDVVLRTVNDGEITVSGIGGQFDVDNVNGGATLDVARGAGRVHTVNGDVRVTLGSVPAGRCHFETLNGEVEVRVPGNLAADVFFQTFNGEAYTDFELTSRPGPLPVVEERQGKRVYRSGRGAAYRIGAGGPELSLETFNGDIRLVKGK